MQKENMGSIAAILYTIFFTYCVLYNITPFQITYHFKTHNIHKILYAKIYNPAVQDQNMGSISTSHYIISVVYYPLQNIR